MHKDKTSRSALESEDAKSIKYNKISHLHAQIRIISKNKTRIFLLKTTFKEQSASSLSEEEIKAPVCSRRSSPAGPDIAGWVMARVKLHPRKRNNRWIVSRSTLGTVEKTWQH